MSRDDVITNLLNDGQRLFEELQLIGKYILFFRKRYGKRFKNFKFDLGELSVNRKVKLDYEDWQACIERLRVISRKYKNNLRTLRKYREEIDVLKEFFRELRKTYKASLYYKKLEEKGKCQPDFECRFENGEIFFVEVTKMLCAGGKTKAKNLFYRKLEKKIKKSLQQNGYDNLDILIEPYFSKKLKDKNLEAFVLEFMNLLKLYCKSFDKSISISEDKLKEANFKLLSGFVKRVVIWKSDRLRIEINKWFTDTECLVKEIENIINTKNDKSYGQRPLWLLIHIDDATTNAKVIEKLIANKAFESLKSKEVKFNRIYLQLSYCPDVSGYPIFRIK